MSVYQSLYDIVVGFIYGNPETLTADMTLTATLVSTIGSVVACALPFIACVWVFRAIFNIGR